jgi:OOP family OmpA-OmpF porin
MHSNPSRIVAGLLSVCFLALGTAFAVPQGEKTKVKGMITGRTGDTLIVKSPDGNAIVVLDDDTKVQRPTGVFRKKQMSAAVLIPGLKVSVDGVSDNQNRVLAKSITFDSSDLETAEMIQAGLHPTAAQVAINQQKIGVNAQNIEGNKQNITANQQNIAANKQNIGTNQQAIQENIKDIEEANKRFDDLSEYDVKAQATINFAVGSAKISAQDEKELTDLAHKAVNLSGYLIEVKGFADSSGNAAMNQQLSEDRAQTVVEFLIQNCNVPVRHVVAPGAMGISHPAVSNETAAGRSENRRVEVKILLNRGLAGK